MIKPCSNSRFFSVIILAFIASTSGQVSAWNSKDGSLEVHGFVDSTTHGRLDYGLSKQRIRGQVEWSKIFKPNGVFSEISMHGTFRAVYDGAFDLNSDEYGDDSGSNVFGRSSGLGNLETPWGMSPVTAGNPNLPGGGDFGFDLGVNPDVGLKRVSGVDSQELPCLLR